VKIWAFRQGYFALFLLQFTSLILSISGLAFCGVARCEGGLKRAAVWVGARDALAAAFKRDAVGPVHEPMFEKRWVEVST
jgi:hypothetical protein